MIHSSRQALIEMVRRRDIEQGYPRLIVSMILASSGVVAFLCSFVLLQTSTARMGLRYAVSTAAGYLAFLLCIRLWIAYRRGLRDPGLDVPDLFPDVGGARPSVPDGSKLFLGGRSGGGGGGASWDDTNVARVGGTGSRGAGSSGGSGLSVDLDDLWPLVVVAVAAFCGAIALGYLLYLAPALLAELAVDAAVVGAMYGRLREKDVRSWLSTALRRTWLPALGVVAAAALLGLGLQWAAPDARSIGPAVEALLGRGSPR